MDENRFKIVNISVQVGEQTRDWGKVRNVVFGAHRGKNRKGVRINACYLFIF